MIDENLPDSEWIESIGSYIASKPPDKWNDNDENIFNRELIQKAMRFSRVESVVFPNTGKLEDSVGMRLSLTQSDGNELEKVIYIRPDEEDEIKNLQKKINTMIEKNKVLGLAAAYRAIWDTLSKAKG